MTGSLFSPISIGDLTLRNRIQMSSMVTNFASPDGHITERGIRYYAERARGGCALVMVEATYIMQEGKSFPFGLGLDDDDKIEGFRALNAAIHAHGAASGIQLQHGGRFAVPAFSGHPAALVSRVPGLTPENSSFVLSEEDIADIVSRYADAAERAVRAGFDLIELHGAHGYLLAQFLSPLTNRRGDCYGGSFEKRLRLPLDVLSACRARVGKNVPIVMRLSVEEFLEGGLDLAMSLDIAKALVDAGIDGLNISVGAGESNHYTIPPACIPQGFNGERAAAIRHAVEGRVPVAVAGRITDRKSAERLLEENKADIVVMGRALLADPFLPRKLEAGDDAAIAPCLACNEGCAGALAKRAPISCAVNPFVGKEALKDIQNAEPKRIAVAGGGPAGMAAALFMAERGHTVTLYERSSELGGMLSPVSRLCHKDSYQHLCSYFQTALERSSVAVKKSCTFDPEKITQKPDLLVVAAGGADVHPASLTCSERVVTVSQVLAGHECGKRCLVVGGGLSGCELALWLARLDKDVTVVEAGPQLAANMEQRTRRFFMPHLQAVGVKTFTGTEVAGFDNDGTVLLRLGEEILRIHDIDTVILAAGRKPNDDGLICALESCGLSYRRIGDVASCRNVMHAIHDAFSLSQEY